MEFELKRDTSPLQSRLEIIDMIYEFEKKKSQKRLDQALDYLK